MALSSYLHMISHQGVECLRIGWHQEICNSRHAFSELPESQFEVDDHRFRCNRLTLYFAESFSMTQVLSLAQLLGVLLISSGSGRVLKEGPESSDV